MSDPEEYVSGDVNTIDDVDDDVDDDIEDYEEGDINTLDDSVDDEDDDEDEDEDDEVQPGNRGEASMPTDVLVYLARSLANEPDSVVVQTDQRPGSVRLRLHVAPDDMGRVIGRRGRTAQALRTLIGVAGTRDGVQTSVDIVDD